MGQDWADYVTARQAAIRLGVSRQRVSVLIREGRIPFKIRDGFFCMIKLSDLDRFSSIKRPTGRPRSSPSD
jgi:excisionase family DNA binding protein